MHACDPDMSSKSEESKSSADNFDFQNNVNSVLTAIKAAMKPALAMVVMSKVESQCDETKNSPMIFRLQRALKINAKITWEKRARLTYSDDWKRVGAIAKENVVKLQDAYSIMLNLRNQLITVEKLYGAEKIQKLFQAEYLKIGQSRQVKIKNSARSKAGRKKSAHLNMWHNCMKAARKNLGIVGKAMPKKDTPYYNECKRLMLEKK